MNTSYKIKINSDRQIKELIVKNINKKQKYVKELMMSFDLSLWLNGDDYGMLNTRNKVMKNIGNTMNIIGCVGLFDTFDEMIDNFKIFWNNVSEEVYCNIIFSKQMEDELKFGIFDFIARIIYDFTYLNDELEEYIGANGVGAYVRKQL